MVASSVSPLISAPPLYGRRQELDVFAGLLDGVTGASRSNFGKYARSTAVTEFKELPGRSHLIAGQADWEEIADFALSWATANAIANGPLTAEPNLAAVARG